MSNAMSIHLRQRRRYSARIAFSKDLDRFIRERIRSPWKRVTVAALSVLGLAGTLPISAFGASSLYIAQATQGSGNGSNCANARPASWFNSSSNWGTTAGQIGPGTTVFLCGTITTNLTFQGSGSASAYVTVDGTGAIYSGQFSTGANESWWKVQNVVWIDGYANNLITVSGGSNGVFTGNYADNIKSGVFLAQYNGSILPNNITISNNFLRTSAADLGNTQVDIIVTEGSTNVLVEGNYLEMRAGGSGSSAHDDCIQTWEKGGSSGGPPSNWTIRYNKIVMNSAASNDRSWTMLESLAGTNNIYDNVFLGLQGASAANGLNANSNRSGVVFNIFNNTFVVKNSASNNIINLSAPGTANIRNNIVYAGGQTALTGSMTINRSNNIWYGSNIPSCTGISGELCRIDPLFNDYLNNDFSLAVNSPAIASALNLGPPYDKLVSQKATWPSPLLSERPPTGSWSAGAYDTVNGASTVTPPTNLKVTP